MNYWIDIHSHSGVSSGKTIAHPTVSLFDKVRISTCLERFWCGVHPYDYMLFDNECLNLMDSLSERLVGVGEIGLDYSMEGVDREEQMRVFTAQYDYAKAKNIAVTIHCVKAYNDMFTLLRQHNLYAHRTLFHSFIGSPQMAQQFIDLGCLLSFSPTSFQSAKTVEVIKIVPIKQLFLESDNEDGKPQVDIELLYQKCAAVRGVEVEMLKEQIFVNYKNL